MERIRVRDDNSGPDPAETPAAPLIQADLPLLTPNRREFDPEYPAWPFTSPPTANLQYSDKSRASSLRSLHLKLTHLRLEPPRSKPLFRGFERPSFSRIAILTTLCLLTYPAFYILEFVAKDRSLFVVRSTTSVWCSAVGFALGYILLKVGARHLEAATWATVIHMSHEGDGMTLRNLARGSSDPTSFMSAVHLFRSRFRDRGTSRRSRKSYDKRPWSLFLAFFVILVTLAPLLPFIFGRIVEIRVFVRPQRKVYSEVLITGDLSEEDVIRAEARMGYSKTDPYTAEFVYGNDTVYFAQPSPSQFFPGGSGAAIFKQGPAMGVKDPLNNTLAFTERNIPKNDAGGILRYPQWGIRIHCEKLPDPGVNMIPTSPNAGFVYAFIPRDFLQGLFGVYGMSLPTEFMKPDLDVLHTNIPSNIDLSKISSIAVGTSPVTALRLNSPTTHHVATDQGWITVETVFVQLNTSLTPSGRFPLYRNESSPSLGGPVTVGCDAAVCVKKYEPWIVEAYNTSTGSSFTLRIVEKQNGSTSLLPSGIIQGARIVGTRYLNATGKDFMFSTVYNASVDRVWEVTKNQGNKSTPRYSPTPTIVSFTEGTGLRGYVELSPDRFAVFRARSDAVNVLPYLVGSGPVVAQFYKDETLAYTAYKPWQMIALLVLVLILGTIGELFVPALPLNIPRRGFGLYSWLALFQSQELQFEAADDLGKFTSLDELEESFSDKRVKFVV